MIHTKNEWFIDGTVNRARPDIVIEFKVRSFKKVKRMTEYQRHQTLKWLEEQQQKLKEWTEEIRKA